MWGMDEVGLGKLVQAARKKSGLTQQELCERSGLSYSTLAKIERGAIKAPSIFTIQKIATVLGTDLNTLFGNTTVPSNEKPRWRSKTGVRFIYFDINGCLIRFFHKAFTKLAAESGASAETIESFFWHYNDSVCRGEISVEELNEKLAEAIKVPEINWLDYYLEAVEPIQEMHDLVIWAAQHYRVGLLTNIMPGLVVALKKKGLIPNINYDVIIDSSEVGAVKPESKIYEIAQSKSGVKPEEILLVDDTRANLSAAEHMGWHVLWFDDYEPENSIPKIRTALEPESA
jgi:HAD superfamily hydrolase (TIGR01509 family)